MRVLIAEDEHLARNGLVAMLRAIPDVEVVGQAADGDDALRAIKAEQPDVVLLDVRMPRRTGLDVARAIRADIMPLIVFITAHDEFAVEGYEVQALDYLIKPFSDERLHAAIDRARQALAKRKSDPALDRLVLKTGDRTRLVPVSSILRIESADYCARVVTTGGSWLVRQSLATLTQRLAPHGFLRLNRSVTARLGDIREVARHGHGRIDVVLVDGSTHRVTARCRRAFEDALSAYAR